jgi:translation initiation factor 2A
LQSQCCAFQWNPQGTNVLITSSCDYDATNSSYFGEAKLYYMSADGKTDMIVPLDKDGSILDSQWSPNGDSFVAVYGTMPSTATLFNDKCKPLCKLMTGPYNTVRFSPNGRFILLAGFGQLPGDIQLFDRQGPSECVKMGGTKSECSVVCEWAPCSRHFMTACTAPRMRIDNRISVYTYYGERVHQTEFKELLDARWRPASRVRHSITYM